MSERPQVKLCAEWLNRYLAGQTVLSGFTSRPYLEEGLPALVGRRMVRCSARGKHLFLDFGDDLLLHNHLLMRGKWRRRQGQFLFPPPGAWLGLYLGPYTVCNFGGQLLRFASGEDVRGVMARLGPDTMEDPYPREAVVGALASCPLPIAEALFRQSVVCGVGNVARSEALHRAGIDPRARRTELAAAHLERLADAIHEVLQASYRKGGQWIHRIYRRHGQHCPDCGMAVRLMRLNPSRRSIHLCPRCQRRP